MNHIIFYPRRGNQISRMPFTMTLHIYERDFSTFFLNEDNIVFVFQIGCDVACLSPSEHYEWEPRGRAGYCRFWSTRLRCHWCFLTGILQVIPFVSIWYVIFYFSIQPYFCVNFYTPRYYCQIVCSHCATKTAIGTVRQISISASCGDLILKVRKCCLYFGSIIDNQN